MEGGAVDFNGAGTVLTTTSCLLNKNRNPQASRKQQIEQYLRDYYGQKHVVWLGEGIEGDDTDGHIDDLARFLDERTIAIGIETNKRDPNYAILQKARRAHREGARSGRPAVRDRRTADAEADRVRRPAPAGDLRELLFRRTARCWCRPSASAIATARRSRSCRGTCPSRKVIGVDCREADLGARARFTASRSSSPGSSRRRLRPRRCSRRSRRPVGGSVGSRCAWYNQGFSCVPVNGPTAPDPAKGRTIMKPEFHPEYQEVTVALRLWRVRGRRAAPARICTSTSAPSAIRSSPAARSCSIPKAASTGSPRSSARRRSSSQDRGEGRQGHQGQAGRQKEGRSRIARAAYSGYGSVAPSNVTSKSTTGASARKTMKV